MKEQFEKAETGVPAGRDKLNALALNLEQGTVTPHGGATAIRAIIKGHLHRRRPTRKASPRSEKMTLALEREIRGYGYSNPEASYMQIGHRFNVSSGRVSEAIAGKRR